MKMTLLEARRIADTYTNQSWNFKRRPDGRTTAQLT